MQRFLMELGFLRAALVCGFVLAIFIFLFFHLNSHKIVWGGIAIYSLLITSIQFSRNDKLFLKSIFINPRLAFTIEYVCLTIPLSVLLLAKGYIFPSLSFIPIVFLIPFLNYSVSIQPKWQMSFPFLPATAFEWKVGLRQNLWVIILLQVAGLFFYPYQVSFFIVILLIGIITATFYLEMESRLMLESQLEVWKQSNFLIKKIGHAFLLLFMNTLPISIAFFIFHFNFWYLFLGLFLLTFLLLAFSITVKYAFYEEGKNQRFMLAILQSLAIILLILPFISGFPSPILLFILLVYFFRKAQKNLKEYAID